MTLEGIVRAAGLGQLVLAVASTALPHLLDWRGQVAVLRPLLRRIFWIYAGYVLAIHVAFGLVSSIAPRWLLDGSGLAGAVTGFMALYWAVRIVLQFTVIDRADAPGGPWFRVGEAALVLLFAALTATYGAAFAWNLR
jgi:hypothetical protein